ncbi:MAG: hypothetical protein A3K08_01555 [Candidatus Doudnabacteria bacterium RIFCSPLOWO2_01_41_7]|nr:MAG: hypothetical protein A3K08_01555 [Candidatus Doudnabacteria bacterium RIFCSPLOWO2_01_41_7]
MYKTIPQTRDNRKITYWGIAFGVLPDLVSFTPVFFYAFYASIFLQQPFFAGPPGNDNPFFEYAVQTYNYSHSIVIWAAVLILVWLIPHLFWKKGAGFPWILLGWALHIFIDIFTHTEAFFATPFLFPLSGLKVSVISWAHPVFMVINYSLLLILYFIVIPKFRATK